MAGTMLFSTPAPVYATGTQVAQLGNLIFCDDFSQNTIGTQWKEYGSNQSDWKIENGNCSSIAEGYPNGVGQKLLRENFTVTDFELSTKIVLKSGGDAGVIFRASDVNDNGDGYRGYYAGVSSDSLILGRSNQGWDADFEIKQTVSVEQNEVYLLKIYAEGSKIEISLWDEQGKTRFAQIEKTDSEYASGQVGLRAHNTKAVYDDFSITEIQKKNVVNIELEKSPNKMTYWKNEVFDPDGMEVKVTYDDNTTVTLANEELEYEYDFSEADKESQVKIKYRNMTVTLIVEVKDNAISFPYSDDFSNDKSNWTTYGCSSHIESESLVIGESGAGRKAILQGLEAGDILMQSDVTLLTEGDAGLMFRCTDITEGVDGFKGYYAYISSDGFVSLGRADGAVWDGDFDNANHVATDIQLGETYNIMVVAKENEIQLYLDGILVNTITDRMSVNGKVGYRAHQAKVQYDNLYLAEADSEISVTKLYLQRTYDRYKNEERLDASEQAWNAFSNALSEAQKVLAMEQPGKELINETLKVLKTSYLNLRKEAEVSAPGSLNPLMPGYGADPTIHKFGDTYYLYSTTTDRDFEDKPMVWYSKDLVNWEGQRLEMKVDEESYGGIYEHTMQWASSVIEHDGKYYMYYTVYDKVHQSQEMKENNIVAVADNPKGPFVIKRAISLGDPSLPGVENNTHDPQVFYDENTDKTYLLYGGFFATLFIEELNPNDFTRTVPGTRKALLYGSMSGNGNYAPGQVVGEGKGHQEFAEGAFVYTRELENEDGSTFTRYYLTYSCEDYSSSTYKVRYAYSDNGIMGPYTYLPDAKEYYSDTPSNIVIRTSEKESVDGYRIANGPGHHSVIQVEVNGELQDYIVYHKLASEGNTGRVHRQVCIDRIYYTEDGLIKEVKPTLSASGVDAIAGIQRKQTLADNRSSVEASFTANTAGVYPFNAPQYALDDNYSTMWLTKAPVGNDPDSAQTLTVDLGSIQTINGFKTDFWLTHRLHKYIIETSLDGEKWELYSDKTDNTYVGTLQDDCEEVQARYARITIVDMERYPDEIGNDSLLSGIWEFSIYGENEKIDKSELQAYYDQHKGKRAEDYIAGFEDYQMALEEAEKVLKADDATQEEVDRALATLKEAVAGLKIKDQEEKPGQENQPQTDSDKKDENEQKIEEIIEMPVKTGDDSSVAMVAGVMIMAVGTAGICYYKRKRKI